MAIYEQLGTEQAIQAYNPENYTGYGLRTVRIYGEDFVIHDTRNFLTNFGIIRELQSRDPANPYEDLMRREIRDRKVYPIVEELHLNNPDLHDTLVAITGELRSSRPDPAIHDNPVDTEPIEAQGRDEVMNLYRYWASKGFDDIAPIARRHFREFDISFFCR